MVPDGGWGATSRRGAHRALPCRGPATARANALAVGADRLQSWCGSPCVTRSFFRAPPSEQCQLQDPRHHPAGVKVLLSEGARAPPVRLIIRLDRRQGARDFFHRTESEKPFSVGNPAGSGMLDHGGFSTGEITERAVAGPAVHELRTIGFDAAEFTARPLDVIAVLLGRGAHVPRLANPPPQRLETRSPLVDLLPEADGQLESCRGPGRQRRVLEERGPLVVGERLPLELESPSPPVRDGRIGRAGLRGCDRPFGKTYRRRGIVPAQTAVGETSRRGADGLPDREVDIVGRHG